MRYLFPSDSARCRRLRRPARGRCGGATTSTPPPVRKDVPCARPAAAEPAPRARAGRGPPRVPGVGASLDDLQRMVRRYQKEREAVMRHQLRYHGKWLIAIAFFALLAAAAATWILTNQRLRTPFADRYTVRVEFANTQSLTAGLGQPVNVAGVRVGDIVSTELRGRPLGGRAVDRDRPAAGGVRRRPGRAAPEHPARGHADRAVPGQARRRASSARTTWCGWRTRRCRSTPRS